MTNAFSFCFMYYMFVIIMQIPILLNRYTDANHDGPVYETGLTKFFFLVFSFETVPEGSKFDVNKALVKLFFVMILSFLNIILQYKFLSVLESE